MQGLHHLDGLVLIQFIFFVKVVVFFKEVNPLLVKAGRLWQFRVDMRFETYSKTTVVNEDIVH